LPNRRLVDITRPDVSADFGEPVEDMEAPWGNAQVVFAYDTARTPDPPETFGALIEWIRKHPGRFTYPAPPDFTGSVFVRHAFYHVSDLPPAAWRGSIDESVYRATARKCFQLLRFIKPDLWRQGRTYPDSQIRMSQLFADGELDFTFGYDPAEPSKRIHDGLYPKTVRTFVFTEGTIANTHFTTIPFNAADPEAAMVTSNFLLSPEAQFQQSDPTVWGTLPVIEIDRLPQPWRRRFNTRPLGAATLPPAVLKQHRLPEPSSEILIRLERGWTRRVLKGR
jgi:putative spermidine/putrescine transport system substrate-binding protein